jgi:hypothetical protein
MSTSNETTEQYAYIDYPREAAPSRRGVLEDIRPMLPGDEEAFGKFPDSAYVLRDWKPIDDINGMESANLYDMWGVVVVFPNGLHVHEWYPIPLYGRKPVAFPYERAGRLAEELLGEVESLQDYRSRTRFIVAECVKNYGQKDDPRRIESARRGRRSGGM